MATGSYEMTNT